MLSSALVIALHVKLTSDQLLSDTCGDFILKCVDGTDMSVLSLPVHGSVLVLLQSGWIRSQPPPSISFRPQTPPAPDPPLRVAVPRPAVGICHQIHKETQWLTALGLGLTAGRHTVRSVSESDGQRTSTLL